MTSLNISLATKAGGDWTGKPAHEWHSIIVPLRSLSKKAPNEFPNIDLGLLPTKKTHAAKRTHAGIAKYYLEPSQINKMIYEAEEKRDKAMLAFLFNIICRTTALTELKVDDIDLKKHFAKVKDKGDITWLCFGLSDETCQFIAEYLKERGLIVELQKPELKLPPNLKTNLSHFC